MFKTIFQNLKVGFSDVKVVDKNCCYVTIVTLLDSKVSQIE